MRHRSVSGRDDQNFESIERSSVPTTRKGKHHDIVEKILSDLSGMTGKRALRVPRAALGDAKIEHIRAALTRASARTKLALATSADDQYFYVWRED